MPFGRFFMPAARASLPHRKGDILMSYDQITPFDSPACPAPESARRTKTGGRRKGTPNKTTRALRDAVLEAFGRLQDEAGGKNGHLVDWARDNPTEFYKL